MTHQFCEETYHQTAEKGLAALPEVKNALSAFNVNIDAVISLSGKQIESLCAQTGLTPETLDRPVRTVATPADVVRGLLKCFRGGFAEEWLISEKNVADQIRQLLDTPRLQMGGQAGIVANALAAAGVSDIAVHCAALSGTQAGLFPDSPTLLSVDNSGELNPVRKIARANDPDLVHWIFEFSGKDKVTLGDKTWECPKSNRFIATYDPLNASLRIDETLMKRAAEMKPDIAVLSGFHLMSSQPAENGPSGVGHLRNFSKQIRAWCAQTPQTLMHLELASTADPEIRRAILEHVVPHMESLGCNERELIDFLKTLGYDHLAECATSPENLLESTATLFRETGCKRLQLHMYGLYLTLLAPDFPLYATESRDGMITAAAAAAAKASGTTFHAPADFLAAPHFRPSDAGLDHLRTLSEMLNKNKTLEKTGIVETSDFTLIAIPSILVDNPVTLVGMGDTISSLSLAASVGFSKLR